jgi:streptogramin lyase
VEIDSQAAGVRWTDQRIDLVLPAGVRTGNLVVHTPSGEDTVRLEVYRLEEWDLPPSTGTNPAPLALARDGAGRLWINEEFHNQLKTFDPSVPGGAPVAVNVPHPADPGPFAVFFDELFGQPNVDLRTQTSVLGESIIVDPSGFVWASEGGGLLYDKTHPNHSRILRYDPAGGTFRVYNVPGDRNEVVGLAWDATRGRVWFAEGATGAITGFDPERAPWDNAFDFSTSLDAHVNPANAADGFRRFNVPAPNGYPSCLAVDAQGGVWFTSFLGNKVGRLDPDTGTFVEVPLPKRRSTARPAAIFDTGGPWQIAIAPDGEVVIDESFDFTVDRIDAERVRQGDPACKALDATGKNPCVVEVAVEEDASVLSTAETDLLHTVGFDAEGRLWYGRHGPQTGSAFPDTLGIVGPNFDWTARFPPLRAEGDTTPVGVTGLAFDPRGGVIWFEEFWAKKIARLTRL